MAITSVGIGSGLDVNGLVSQLVTAEGAPEQTRLVKAEARFQVKLSAFGSLRAALDKFETALAKLKTGESLDQRSASLGDEDLLSVTVDSDAVAGRYAVEVLNLAANHKLGSAAFASADAVVGTGALTVTVGDTVLEIPVDEESNTLAGIRDAINGAEGNEAVRASLITDDEGTHLLLQATDTGLDNAITVTQSGGDGGLAALAYTEGALDNGLSQVQAALDATVEIDGYRINSATNQVAGALEGVTLDLLAAEPGKRVELEVQVDRAAATKAVKDFVSAYNGLVKNLADLTRFDPETLQAGPLTGDSTVRSLQAVLRREMGAAISGLAADVDSLHGLGVSTELDGTRKIDDDRLKEVIDGNLSSVRSLLAGEDGLAARIEAALAPYADADGVIAGRTDGLKKNIENIGDRREALQRRLASYEARMRKQFNALDSLLGQMQSTSSYLSQQLANLPGFGG